MKIVRLEDAKDWPDLQSLSPDELQQAYALARQAFTAGDLQQFTELVDETVSMDAFLAEF